MKKQKVTIIGWTDWFWKWLAWFILKNFRKDVELIITGRNKEKGEKVSKELQCFFTLNPENILKDSDITIFSVPIAYTIDTIKKFAPYLKEGSIVCDVTSIKKEPSEILKKYSSKWVLVIPTHPMFWPFVSTLSGQNIILTPDKETKNNQKYKFFKKLLLDFWMNVIEEDPIEHDKMMAVVQWLTHLNMFVLADTMKKLNFDLKKSFNFMSPIYKLIISSIWRYIWQNPKLYADIQMNNSEILKVHNKFIESIQEFNNFVLKKDENSFIRKIKEAEKFFGEEVKNWQLYTDKIIFMLSKQIEKAESLVNKDIILENIYSREEIKDKLVKIEGKKLFLKNWKILDLDQWEIL